MADKHPDATMTPALHDLILERLAGDDGIDDTALRLVDAACRGGKVLAAQLGKLGDEVSRVAAAGPAHAPGAAAVYVERLRVAGFRGIGPARQLELRPGPGLTLIVGRNGSGKSSFAEALETLLTRDSRRWQSRPKDWRDGWRNLHVSSAAIDATFLVEGDGRVIVRRRWDDGADLNTSTLGVQRDGSDLAGLEALGWARALDTFRPFLSYSELGAVLAEPSKLHDELSSILGLGAISAAIDRLNDQYRRRDKQRKQARDELAPLVKALESMDDPRARQCRDALAGRTWALDEVEAALLGGGNDADTGELTHLRRLAQLPLPNLAQLEQAVAALRDAITARAALADTGEAQRAALAQLLEHAVAYVDGHGGDCPVCQAALPGDWAASARVRLDQARTQARAVRDAGAQVATRQRAVRQHMRQPPPALTQAEALGLGSEALAAWRAWADAPDEPAALCDHAETGALAVHETVDSLRHAARRRLDAMESTWRPLARQLAAWLKTARAVQADSEARSALQRARTWLKDAEAAIRADRFEPIAARAQQTWNLLRQDSNVELRRVALEGKATRRRVALDVDVDGKPGVAVGVMSQGELNALALSLFLPRMTLPDSPFRFVVIDDPVQAMDPHKVDGLARVLEQVAAVRQVIVLTHDTRLLEAVRRLGIEATAVEVSRRAQSVVEVRGVLDPVEHHLADARRCLHDEDALGPGLAARVVPVFCRLAVEAACSEAVRRRRLGRGDRHADVEQAIAGARGLHQLAALAVADDSGDGNRVYQYLNNKLGRDAGDAFKRIKQSVHAGGELGPLAELVADARAIATTLRRVA